jgi:transcription elongation GreA/GreB family factor
MGGIDKAALLSELKARLQREFDTLVAAHHATQEGATHEESRPENDKDTRAVEQSYLARGQAERVRALQDDLQKLAHLSLRPLSSDSTVVLGALITVESAQGDGEPQLYFLVPAGAGETLTAQGLTIKVVTPGSPLGRSLLGGTVGDEISVRSPMGPRELSIVGLS